MNSSISVFLPVLDRCVPILFLFLFCTPPVYNSIYENSLDQNIFKSNKLHFSISLQKNWDVVIKPNGKNHNVDKTLFPHYFLRTRFGSHVNLLFG
jgi:hypothetical protein